ncbi:MAG TPA: molecular chaperone TorD family protein [Burkholderiaceae bacterium]
MSAATVGTGSLAGAYLAMSQLFSYPNPESWQRLTEHGLIDPALIPEALEAEYMAAFEVGGGSSPVPLFEGMHRGDMGRDGILEDLLRFYEFFDAKLSETDREYPDHLVTELEFVAWLCLQEDAAESCGRDAEPFRRAARDFIQRHLGAWLPAFCRRLEETGTTYARYTVALSELIEIHRGRLEEHLEASGDGK